MFHVKHPQKAIKQIPNSNNQIGKGKIHHLEIDAWLKAFLFDNWCLVIGH